MSWFKRSEKGIHTKTEEKKDIPKGLWYQTPTGKIIEAKFDFDNGIPAYEIEMAKGMEIYKLMIDSMNGQVISSQLDDDD